MRADKYKKRKKKRTWLKAVGIILLLLLIGGGVFAYNIYHSMRAAVDTMHKPVKSKNSRAGELNFGKEQPFSVLLLGVDQRKGDVGRSDTMIVMTVNLNKESVEMLSIPRDTRVEIVGRGTQDKINAAYAYGGVKMSMDTVQNFLDIPIDYYIKVNMEGFSEIVDALGGVTVNNNLDFSYGGYHFPKGQIDLNGKKAINYVRMRKQDPRGDFGREERQRAVIQGIIDKGASFSSLTHFSDVFQALGKNIETNLSFDDMVSIQKNYRNARKNIEKFQLQGQGQMINKIYYFVVPESERQKAHDRLKTHLEL
ncbi:LytR family transcriptional regulator [Bacillus sp. APMAM]|nr:LytR family transcriptional regulator [Bacillus sp. APMAM]RTZ56750.1 LytR family transcriptional regulator [Bacillus sp. SAJ1]